MLGTFANVFRVFAVLNARQLSCAAVALEDCTSHSTLIDQKSRYFEVGETFWTIPILPKWCCGLWPVMHPAGPLASVYTCTVYVWHTTAPISGASVVVHLCNGCSFSFTPFMLYENIVLLVLYGLYCITFRVLSVQTHSLSLESFCLN